MTDVAFPTIELSDPELEYDGLRQATVYSPALDRRVDCTLWIPPPGRAAPRLVVLLHGVYGSHWAWAAKGAAHLTAARLVAAGTIPPVVLAMPSDGLYGHGSGYVDQRAGAFERWIMDEVPVLAATVAAVDPIFPLAIAGLSMGGFGALSIGARRGDRVAAVAGMSSIIEFAQMSRFVGSLDRYAAVAAPHSVLDAMLANRATLPAIHLDCGTSDPLIEENRRLHAGLEEAGVDHEWHEHSGGHEWAYWRVHLPAALSYCATRLG